MIKQKYNLDDLLTQLREKGYRNIEDIEYAILENNGTDGELAWGFYLDSTIHIIGVAICTHNNLAQTFYDTVGYDSVIARIYIPHGNGMTLVAMASMNKNEMAQFRRVYYWSYRWFGDNTEYVDPIREIYFHNEIDVTDSLYVSVMKRTYTTSEKWWQDQTAGLVEWHVYPIQTDVWIFPEQSYRVKHCEDCPWEYGEQRSYPLVFPIIRRDCDSCPQVRGLQFVKSGARKAFFRWEQGVNHHDWQLSYGPAGTAPDDGTIIDYSQRQSGLIEFDPDSHYVVYVRARCRFARDEYGPWSDPLNFCLNGNGIDEADAAGLTLSPNPTADKVTLGCSTGIRQVTVFNAAGVQVHTESIGSGTSATIDTKGWPAGQYVVTVETTAGTASRVLTVAR